MKMRIGELAMRSECPVETIRFYEREGLLPQPGRSAGNYRLYGDEYLERLRFIKHCRTLDMPLNDVQRLLTFRDDPRQDCGDVNKLLDMRITEVEERVEELQQLKEHLTTLRSQCSRTAPVEACGILRALSDCSCH
ncbi:Cd(II)/Pb(II)-responsive transcriptional regulator [Alcaligenaceae bacterium]|nr:Cd(II)/Pb(II)-responsive transcriptional regulator [Alcaligenaceae bacterium]